MLLLLLLLRSNACALTVHAAHSSWVTHVSCWFMPALGICAQLQLGGRKTSHHTRCNTTQEIKSKAEWRPVEDIKLANKLNPRFGLNWVKLRAWEQSDLDAIIMVVGGGQGYG